MKKIDIAEWEEYQDEMLEYADPSEYLGSVTKTNKPVKEDNRKRNKPVREKQYVWESTL